MTTPTFGERTHEVVGNYLRSALLIDDQLTTRAAAAIELPAPVVDGEDALGEDLPAVQQPTPEELGEPRTGDVQVIELVRAFGKEGIACATLEPSDDDPDLVSRLAERVDMVIVDWDIGDEAGRLALDLIPRLAKVGGRRVIAIYTQDPDPGKVRDKVAELPDAKPGRTAAGVMRVKLPGAIVLILSKPNAATSHVPGGVASVDEATLPSVLIEEFAAEAGGLLANAALRGLAAVRDAAPRALEALGPDLDPGYLVHRLLLGRPADAEDQARLIIADEIAGLLELGGLEDEVAMPAIQAWLTSRPYFEHGFPRSRWDTVFTDGSADDAERMGTMIDRLKIGVPEDEGSGNLKAGALRNTGQLFAATKTAGEESNRRFAHRMTLRARHGTQPRVLSLGTVVEADGKVFVCVLPACDAIRLTKETPFPLLKLRAASGDADANIVLVETGKIHRLAWRLRYDQIQLIDFKPDPVGEVVREQESLQGLRFVAEDGSKYRWIGELREAHALRLTSDLTAGLSRVGLDESEWLRRLGARRKPSGGAS